MTFNNNQLVIKLKETGLEPQSQLQLKEVFLPFFEQAEEWKIKAEKIKITSIEQTDLMKEARAARLALKNIRTTVENKRKALKEESLRYGKAIDGLANVVKYLIVPIEDHLYEQENFIERQQELIKDKAEQERLARLEIFDIDITYVNIRDMTDEQFESYFNDQKRIYEARKAEEKKIEEERIAREKAEAEKREKDRKEMIRLQKEQEAQQKKLNQERKARERAEAELQKKKREEEEKRFAEAERIRKEKEQKEREEQERLAAPDKEKLKRFLNDLDSLQIPLIKSEKYASILNNAVDHIDSAKSILRKIKGD